MGDLNVAAHPVDVTHPASFAAPGDMVQALKRKHHRPHVHDPANCGQPAWVWHFYALFWSPFAKFDQNARSEILAQLASCSASQLLFEACISVSMCERQDAAMAA
jgi:hypothetical protein